MCVCGPNVCDHPRSLHDADAAGDVDADAIQTLVECVIFVNENEKRNLPIAKAQPRGEI